jgi:UPF0755 protein
MQTRKIAAFLFIAVLMLFCATAAYHLAPLSRRGREVTVLLKPGQPLSSLAMLLKEKHVVVNSRVLVLWLMATGTERRIQSGKYLFYEREGVISAAARLRSAEPLSITVTIPEGLTINQIASRLASVLSVDSSEFVGICHSEKFIKRFELDVPSLEGYLFPDTYKFSPFPSASNVASRMTGRFLEIYPSLEQDKASVNLSRKEIVVLASIVEKEAVLASERVLIAGVFHNRLIKGYPLGADPTVRYLLGKFSGPLRVSELQNPSPYNTRIHRGLPPGPICSPGRESLQAALNPADTKDLYFVAKWDGSGAHDFSASNAEHDRKKNEIRKANELRIKAKKQDNP